MNNHIESKAKFVSPKHSAGLSPVGQQSSAALLTRKAVNQPKAGLPPAYQPRPAAVLLSRKEVAQRWHCCVASVARRKDLQPVRFTRRFLRYRLEDVEAVEAAATTTQGRAV